MFICILGDAACDWLAVRVSEKKREREIDREREITGDRERQIDRVKEG